MQVRDSVSCCALTFQGLYSSAHHLLHSNSYWIMKSIIWIMVTIFWIMVTIFYRNIRIQLGLNELVWRELAGGARQVAGALGMAMDYLFMAELQFWICNSAWWEWVGLGKYVCGGSRGAEKEFLWVKTLIHTVKTYQYQTALLKLSCFRLVFSGQHQQS